MNIYKNIYINKAYQKPQGSIYQSHQQNCIWITALWHGLALQLPAHALAVAIVARDEGIADAGAGRRLGVAVVLLAHLPAGPSLVPRG